MNNRQLVDLLNSLGWRWTDKHLILHTTVQGKSYRVALPIQRVNAAVGAAFEEHGIEWPRSVGAQVSVAGWFKSLTRAVKRAAAPIVKRVVPKAIRRAAARLETQAGRYAHKAIRFGKAAIRSPVMTYTLMGLSFVPGVQAIAIPTLAAQQAAKRALDMIDKGMQAARLMERGIRNPQVLAQRALGNQAMQAIRNVKNVAPNNRNALDFMSAFRQQVAA